MKVDANTGKVTMQWRDRRAIVLNRAAYVCESCKVATATEADHIWPKSWGGTDDLENLRATCLPCNRKKGGAPQFRHFSGTTCLWAEKFFCEKAWDQVITAARMMWVGDMLAEGADAQAAWAETLALNPRPIELRRKLAEVLTWLAAGEGISVSLVDDTPQPVQMIVADPSDPINSKLWMSFSDGLIIDRTHCPKRIQAHGHWRKADVFEDGMPNGVCECVLSEAEA